MVVPNLAGQKVRGVTEECSRLGLVPSLIGSGVASGTVARGGYAGNARQPVTVRFGRRRSRDAWCRCAIGSQGVRKGIEVKSVWSRRPEVNRKRGGRRSAQRGT